MNIWERQYDLMELKYIRALKDLGDLEEIYSQPVVQAHPELKKRTADLISVLKLRMRAYRSAMAYAKRMKWTIDKTT